MGKWVRQINDSSQVNYLISEVVDAIHKGLSRGAVVLTLTRPKRTLDQNRLMWPLLTDFSRQVEHFGNKYSPEQWKDLLTASFVGCTEYAPSLDGKSLVAFGVRTSDWPKDTFSAFIEFMYAEGSDRQIEWSKQSNNNYNEVRQAA